MRSLLRFKCSAWISVYIVYIILKRPDSSAQGQLGGLKADEFNALAFAVQTTCLDLHYYLLRYFTIQVGYSGRRPKAQIPYLLWSSSLTGHVHMKPFPKGRQ